MGRDVYMEPSYITEKVFTEATKRIDDENHRQNERISALENNYTIVNQLSIHMERLATNMEAMAKSLLGRAKSSMIWK